MIWDLLGLVNGQVLLIAMISGIGAMLFTLQCKDKDEDE